MSIGGWCAVRSGPDLRRRPLRLVRRMAIGALIAGGLALMLTWLLAPQILVLIREGFPAPVWPAAGQFAQVQGTPAADPQPGGVPPGAAMDRFDQTGGRALLMARDGALTVEVYGDGIDRQTRLNSYSLVKSLVGALVLRAQADGRISGLDDRLRDYMGPDAPDVSIGETLTMTAGLTQDGEPPKSMDDGGFSAFGPLARMHAYGIRTVLPDLGVDPALRGQFHYQSAATALLGLLLETVYDQPLPKILSEKIWQPAGAETAFWREYPAGDGVSAYCCLYARPLDWVRVGDYILHNGSQDQPFLPEDLWRQFVTPDLPRAQQQRGSYGLHLRHDILDRPGQGVQGPFSYFMGHHGQMVYLLPQEGAVVVRFGQEPQLLHSTIYELFGPT